MSRLIPIILALAAVAPGQSDGPTALEIDALKASLSAARKAKDDGALINALEKAIWLDDKRVTRLVTPYIAHEVDSVAEAAVKALRYHENKSSYKALVKAEASKVARKRPELRGHILLAIGQCGDKKAISTLVDAIKSTRARPVHRAATMALAHIRHKEAVDAAIKLLTVTGRRAGGRRGGGNNPDRGPTGPYLTLHYLTTRTHDQDPGKWKKWWRSNRSTFEIPKTPIGVERRLAQRYEATWKRPTKDGENPRRRRRDKNGG